MEKLHARFTEAWHSEASLRHVVAALYVLDLLMIHPFDDGNGRVARLVWLWLMLELGWRWQPPLLLELLIQETRSEYMIAIAEYQDQDPVMSDPRGWIHYFLAVMHELRGGSLCETAA